MPDDPIVGCRPMPSFRDFADRITPFATDHAQRRSNRDCPSYAGLSVPIHELFSYQNYMDKRISLIP